MEDALSNSFLDSTALRLALDGGLFVKTNTKVYIAGTGECNEILIMLQSECSARF